jgi:hypothetical protein
MLLATKLEEIAKKCRMSIVRKINKLKMGWSDISERANT